LFRVPTIDIKIRRRKNGEIDYTQRFFCTPNLSHRQWTTGSGGVRLRAYPRFYFGPTFRAENSNTSRHASEFWMIEPEMAFCDLTGNMDLARRVGEVF